MFRHAVCCLLLALFVQGNTLLHNLPSGHESNHQHTEDNTNHTNLQLSSLEYTVHSGNLEIHEDEDASLSFHVHSETKSEENSDDSPDHSDLLKEGESVNSEDDSEKSNSKEVYDDSETATIESEDLDPEWESTTDSYQDQDYGFPVTEPSFTLTTVPEDDEELENEDLMNGDESTTEDPMLESDSDQNLNQFSTPPNQVEEVSESPVEVIQVEEPELLGDSDNQKHDIKEETHKEDSKYMKNDEVEDITLILTNEIVTESSDSHKTENKKDKLSDKQKSEEKGALNLLHGNSLEHASPEDEHDVDHHYDHEEHHTHTLHEESDGHANKWSYSGNTGPSAWPSMFQTCDGNSQSPINIETSSVRNEFWNPFNLMNYDAIPSAMRVKNNGHAAQVEVDATTAPRATGGGLSGDYIFAQFHFHWGRDSSLGSEHTIDGVRYPMEVHFVHYKAEYGSLGEAIKQSDGLAVLGAMFEISQTDNAALTPLVRALNDITEADAVANVEAIYPLRAFLPRNLERFFRYQGSLTTPTCNEVVTWTVFADPVPVSEAQMNAFRSLAFKDGTTLVNNFRPPQPLQSRRVSVRASSGASSALPFGGGGGSSATMKKLGLALYFMSTMAVMVMNI